MTLSKLAPAVALAVTFGGSLVTAEEPAAPAAESTEASAQATADATAPPAEATLQEPALGPVGHDAQGRAGRIHVVAGGDTLWDISDAYLGTPWVWPSIWKDNTAEVENPHRIYPGERIWISPYEMRKISDAEAAEMLARGPIEEPMPAAMGDPEGPAMPESRETYRYSEIETVGFVTVEELEGAAAIIESSTPRTLLSDNLPVQIGLGQGEIAVGDELEIFRTEEDVVDPSNNRLLGHVTKQLGWLVVTEVHEQAATGMIRMSRSEILRGDHVMPRRQRNMDIPIGGRVNVEGVLVHTPNKRMQMGSGDIVYLNRGAQQGIAVGTPLEVYERMGKGYDTARKQDRALADHVIAKLIVVETRDETAVAVVTHTEAELARGALFRGSDSIRP